MGMDTNPFFIWKFLAPPWVPGPCVTASGNSWANLSTTTVFWDVVPLGALLASCVFLPLVGNKPTNYISKLYGTFLTSASGWELVYGSGHLDWGQPFSLAIGLPTGQVTSFAQLRQRDSLASFCRRVLLPDMIHLHFCLLFLCLLIFSFTGSVVHDLFA